MTPEDLPAFYFKRIDVDDSGCWHWTGTVNEQGYAVGRGTMAARAVYALAYGTEPDTLSHTCHRADVSCRDGNDCRHRACVNPAPDHMESMSKADAVALRRYNRRATCHRGHELVGDNVITVRWTGHPDERKCRTCDNAIQRTKWARKIRTSQ